ncbi:MAG TPA: hypothetical protein VGR45_11610 [Stellaceae bacterium]|nr:hypothetical protein [Stellaceae bacterium]
MKASNLASGSFEAVGSEDIFELTNLSPRMTGLPMSVWVSPRGNARHNVRIKVNMTHGRQMNIDNTTVVAVRPSPRVVAGRLTSDDQRVVAAWTALNAQAIIDYWGEKLDTDQFLSSLERLPQE